MIELGLARIRSLVKNTPFNWKAIHVAGTNGKGTVCAYASAMLHGAGLRCGRFTSPHLLDRWDCISIGEKPISSGLFKDIEAHMMSRSKSENIDASEFEILTATAFEIFHQQQIDVGIVEVGLGGLRDATNILSSPLVTVITKIGCDHQAYLGHSLEEIALQKAGIMKPRAICIADATNDESVRKVLRSHAEAGHAHSIDFVPNGLSDMEMRELEQLLSDPNCAPYQLQNARLAFSAVKAVFRQLNIDIPQDDLARSIQETSWPGRLQTIHLKGVRHLDRTVLLDGAHNDQAAQNLGQYVDARYRIPQAHVTWLLALSSGKDERGILSALLRPGDAVVATNFGEVDRMPWVEALDPSALINEAQNMCKLQWSSVVRGNVHAALEEAARIANGGPLIIAGSLYLVSDVLRWQRALNT